jgi:hypothetical protein
MSAGRDPIQSALEAIRREHPTEGPSDRALEARLMAAYDRRRSRGPGLGTAGRVALLAAVLLGGGSFVAADGLAPIRRLLGLWINGRPAHVELDERGRADFSVPTGAGDEARVRVESGPTADDGMRTAVRVETDDVVEAEEHVVGPVRSGGVDEATVRALAGRTPLLEWIDGRGALRELHAVPGGDDRAVLLLRTGAGGASTRVERLGPAPAGVLGPDVSAWRDDGGAVVIRISEAGETRELRLRLGTDHVPAGSSDGAPTADAPTPPDAIDITVPELNVRVPLAPPAQPAGGTDPPGAPDP